jgi:hypothetical protein
VAGADITQEQRQHLHARLDEVIDRVKAQRTVDEMVGALRDVGFRLLLMVMQAVVAARGDGHVGARMPCPCGCGRELGCQERKRPRWVQTLFGALLVVRSYYVGCMHGGGCCPLDAVLSVAGETLAPAMQKQVALMSVLTPFRTGMDALERLNGCKVSPKKAYTLTHKRGMQAWALEVWRALSAWEGRAELRRQALRGKRKGRAYVLVDGTSIGIEGLQEFKECKSAIIFWESDLVTVRPRKKGRRPRRYLKRKRIISHVGSKEQFTPLLWSAMVEEGVLGARQIVWLADGGKWIWNLREQLLPRGEGWNVKEVLDYYHLKQNLWKGARAAFGKDDEAAAKWVCEARSHLMERSDVEAVIGAIDLLISAKGLDEQAIRVLDNLRNYIGGSEPDARERVRYKLLRDARLLISSGAIESVNHGVIQARFKLPGMRWGLLGANAMLRLRNAYFSGTWDRLWETLLRPEVERETRCIAATIEQIYEQREATLRENLDGSPARAGRARESALQEAV